MYPEVTSLMEWKQTLQGHLYSKYECFLMRVCWDTCINFWKKKLADKTLPQCQCDANVDVDVDADVDADTDHQDDYNSSPCTSYRQVKTKQNKTHGVKIQNIPETSHFFRVIKGSGSKSYIEAVTPSMVPNSLPIPRDNNIIKKMIDQKGAEGPNSTIAWVKITNASPVPEAACKHKTHQSCILIEKYGILGEVCMFYMNVFF